VLGSKGVEIASQGLRKRRNGVRQDCEWVETILDMRDEIDVPRRRTLGVVLLGLDVATYNDQLLTPCRCTIRFGLTLLFDLGIECLDILGGGILLKFNDVVRFDRDRIVSANASVFPLTSTYTWYVVLKRRLV
jgi:hypothetical protein